MSTELSLPPKLAILSVAAAAASLALPQAQAQAAGGTTGDVSPAGSDSDTHDPHHSQGAALHAARLD